MDKDELWRSTLSLMLENVSEDDLKSVFLKRLSPLGLFGDQFILLAENAQVESWVRSNYLAEMNEKATLAAGRPLHVDVATPQTPATEPAPAPAEKAPAEPTPQPAASATVPPLGIDREPTPAETSAPDEPDWLNTYVTLSDLKPAGDTRPVESSHPGAEEIVKRGNAYVPSTREGEEALFEKCTFDTFVVGKSNEFAWGAARAVAEKPGATYNPLFIYGSSGLGKTHLLVAIANYVLENWPTMTTRYVSANRFLNDYVEAVRGHDWTSFNKKYHEVDILLVDDVQYLEGRTETIDQLFNIFNEMTNQSKQIVLAADRAPKDIDMDERYRSRFMSGLLADVKPPDYETRLAIMKNYLPSVSRQLDFYGTVPAEVLEWLAGEATSNIREMEGAILRLVSHMSLLHRSTIDVKGAQEVLEDFFPNLTNKKVVVSTIQTEVERFFDITHEQMVGKSRAKGVTMPRHIAIYLSRYLTDESLESIGKKFGGRDHTTVMHSVAKIEKERSENRTLFEQIDQLTIKIKEHS